MNRPLRAGLTAFAAVAVATGVAEAARSSGSCSPGAGQDWSCFGDGAAGLLAAVAIAAAGVLWALRGRGAVHALAGTAVCLLAGFGVVARIAAGIDDLPTGRTGDVAAAAALGLACGLLASLWARVVPGSGRDPAHR